MAAGGAREAEQPQVDERRRANRRPIREVRRRREGEDIPRDGEVRRRPRPLRDRVHR